MKFLLLILALFFGNIRALAQLPWQQVYSGPTLNNFYDIYPADDGNIYALGSTDAGSDIVLLRSNSNGDSGTWVSVPFPPNTLTTAFLPWFSINGRNMYIIANDTLWWSDDYATSWKKRSALPGVLSGYITFIPFVNAIYYNGLYRSFDQGLTWNVVTYIAIHHIIKRGVETFGFNNSTVYKSVDGGATWTNLNALLPAAVYDLTLLSNDSFMMVSGNRVYMSQDAIKWSLKTSIGLPKVMSEPQTLVKAPKSDSVFLSIYNPGSISSEAEIYYSADRGSTWNTFSIGIPTVSMCDIQPLYIANGYVFTTGHTGLIYRTSKPMALATKDIKKSSLLTNLYPNPFANQLTIEGAANSKAILFDMVGQQLLQTTVISDKEVIKTNSMLPGSYILQLTHDNGSRQSFRIEKQ